MSACSRNNDISENNLFEGMESEEAVENEIENENEHGRESPLRLVIGRNRRFSPRSTPSSSSFASAIPSAPVALSESAIVVGAGAGRYQGDGSTSIPNLSLVSTFSSSSTSSSTLPSPSSSSSSSSAATRGAKGGVKEDEGLARRSTRRNGLKVSYMKQHDEESDAEVSEDADENDDDSDDVHAKEEEQDEDGGARTQRKVGRLALKRKSASRKSEEAEQEAEDIYSASQRPMRATSMVRRDRSKIESVSVSRSSRGSRGRNSRVHYAEVNSDESEGNVGIDERVENPVDKLDYDDVERENGIHSGSNSDHESGGVRKSSRESAGRNKYYGNGNESLVPAAAVGVTVRTERGEREGRSRTLADIASTLTLAAPTPPVRMRVRVPIPTPIARSAQSVVKASALQRRQSNDVNIKVAVRGAQVVAEGVIKENVLSSSSSSSTTSTSSAIARIDGRYNNQQQYRIDSDTKKKINSLLTLIEEADKQNLFAESVTDEEAPGYSEIVLRPMDLETARSVIDFDILPYLFLYMNIY